MNKILICMLVLALSGCYTTLTSVASSYDIKKRERLDRNEYRHYESSPFLTINSHLVVRFNQTPARSVAPSEETCEQAMSDELTMVLLSNGDFSLNLNKTIILSEGRTYHVTHFKSYDMKDIIPVAQAPLWSLKKTEKDVVGYAKMFNTDPANISKELKPELDDMNGIELKFDGKFSCGENFYEMHIFIVNDVTGAEEIHRIYFFPWKASITPH